MGGNGDGMEFPAQSLTGAGRPAGSKNRYSRLKASFLDAFYSEKIGGVEGLINWAMENNDNRTHFYKFIVQLMPKDIKLHGDANHPVASQVIINVTDGSIVDDETNAIEGQCITEAELPDSTVVALAHEALPERTT